MTSEDTDNDEVMDEVAVTSAFGAVVALNSRVPEDSLTGSVLGTAWHLVTTV